MAGGLEGNPDRGPSWAFHPSDRNFHLLFIALCWLGVLIGFAPAVTGRMQGQADYVAPLILQLHVFAFVGWLVLFTAQVWLIRSARHALHRKLGIGGAVLAPVMVLSGYFAEVYSQRYYLAHPPDSQQFFIIPIWYVIAFGTLAGAALWQRGNSPAHKRLIVLATAVISGVGYDRWWGEAIRGVLGEAQLGLFVGSYTGTLLLLLLALGHDLRTRGAVHPVHRWGIPFIIAGQVMTVIVYHLPAWLPIARWLVG